MGMLSQEEAQRIAAAVNALRPDWNPVGLMSILADERIRVARTYRDVAVAFTALAADPDSRKPTRILEHGPWWELTRRVAPVYSFPNLEEACAECGQPAHRHTAFAYDDHKFTPPHEHARAITKLEAPDEHP
jgi:hypothetical protein